MNRECEVTDALRKRPRLFVAQNIIMARDKEDVIRSSTCHWKHTHFLYVIVITLPVCYTSISAVCMPRQS